MLVNAIIKFCKGCEATKEPAIDYDDADSYDSLDYCDDELCEHSGGSSEHLEHEIDADVEPEFVDYQTHYHYVDPMGSVEIPCTLKR